jgi:hypothetical protein
MDMKAEVENDSLPPNRYELVLLGQPKDYESVGYYCKRFILNPTFALSG